MKKSISLILVVMMALSTIIVGSIPTNATVKTNGDYKYTIKNKAITITKYKGKSSTVKIPSKLGGHKVTAIGKKAFGGNLNIKAVKIPSTVKSIGDYAFNTCTNLKSITIPSNVKTIGKGAFFSCTRLTKATLKKGITTIKNGAFYNCQRLVTTNIPSTAKKLGSYVFGDCIKLSKVTISKGITTIPPETFLNCAMLKTLKIPSSVKSIGRKAFLKLNLDEMKKNQSNGKTVSQFKGYANITIPSTVKSIGDSCFQYFGNINKVTLNCETIGKNAFESTTVKTLTLTNKVKTLKANCFNNLEVKSIKIPASVTYIDSRAFTDTLCKNITIDKNNLAYTMVNNTIYTKDMKTLVRYIGRNDNAKLVIPDTVTKISSYAFDDCTLKSITIPSSVKSIGKNAFVSCTLSTDLVIPSSVTVINESTFKQITANKIILPNTLTTIKSKAFNDAMANIEIPANVSSIGEMAFYSLEGKITVNSGNKYFKVVNNILFSKDGKKLLEFPSSYGKTSYTIPKGVTTIGKSAFSNSQITKITVPSTLTTIKAEAFDGTPIRVFKLPKTVTTLGKDALLTNSETKNSYIISKSKAVIKFGKTNDIAVFSSTPKVNYSKKSIKGDHSFTFKIKNAKNTKLSFSASKQGIVKITQKGKVTGVKKGKVTVFASTGFVTFKCKVKVTSNAKKTKLKTFNTKGYYFFTNKNYNTWMKSFFKANSNVPKSYIDFPSVHRYTTQQYAPMVAIKGRYHVADTKETYGNDYHRYGLFYVGLNTELRRFKLQQNSVFYSGTGSVKDYTGTGNSMKDMKKAIGKVVTKPEMVSTTLSESTANGFCSNTKYGTILEIYAPKNATVGGYISKVSFFKDSEYEFLLAPNTKYKIIDAGYRYKKIKEYNSTEKAETYKERYLKLQIVE